MSLRASYLQLSVGAKAFLRVENLCLYQVMGIIKQDIYVCNAYLELVMTQLVQRSHHVTECKSNNVISCSLVVVSLICYNLIKPHKPIINVYMKISSMASKQTYYFFHCMEVR